MNPADGASAPPSSAAAAAPGRTPRILLLSSLYPNAVKPTLGVFVETRLQQLRHRHGIDARVVAPVPWFPSTHPRFGDWARQAAVPAVETRGGVELHHPRWPLLPKVGMNPAPWLMARGILPTVRRLLRERDVDLIDAHYFYPDGVAAALVARAVGKPLVITARGSDINLIGQHAIPRRWMQWAARQASACIGVSSALVDAMAEMGFPRERLVVMRNGVDTERFQPMPKAEARQRLGLGPGPWLAMVGNLVELKGHALVVDALAALRARWPGLALAIVGDGPEEGALRAQVQRLGLEQAVRFAGRQPHEALGPWFSAADALVLASSREGWPNVLLEAMACGTPVVATRVGGVPEIVTPTTGVMAERRDAPALAEAIERLLQAPPATDALLAHARAHSWDATSDAQLDLFRRVAAGG